MVSGLRAEKRMDKNGKLVTRHIQYGETSPAPHKLLPSVFGLFGKDDRFPGKTKEILDEPLKYLTGSERRKLMSTLNDDTMRALHSVGVGLDTNEGYAHDSNFGVVIQTCREEGSFALLNNIAFFAHDEGREEASHTIHALIGFVKGLIRYQPEGSSRIDYTTASEEELDDARKLLAVARGVSHQLGSFVESDYDLYTGKGDKYIDSPLAVSKIRDMDQEQAMELASFVVDRDIWFDNEEDVRTAFETFALRGETHDALDDGVL